MDEPLAPLPDDPEVVEGDEEMDQDDAVVIVEPEATQVDAAEADTAATQEDSKPPSPGPQLTTLSLQPSSGLTISDQTDDLDASLKPLDTNIDEEVDVEGKLNDENGLELDIAGLGPDGLQLESAHDLSQMDPEDALIGGSLMDESLDPFAVSMDK